MLAHPHSAHNQSRNAAAAAVGAGMAGFADMGRRRRGPIEVLQLDAGGLPQDWISLKDAALYIASGDVAWQIGQEEPLAVFRGGVNAQTGRQSVIEIPPILALRGQARVNLHDVTPALTNRKLLQRDRMGCCYCPGVFTADELTRDHVIPTSRGGRDIWVNVVSCCRPCNSLKGSRLLSELGWEMRFLPYTPSLYEDFLLRGRKIRQDVHEFLASRLPKGSRLN